MWDTILMLAYPACFVMGVMFSQKVKDALVGIPGEVRSAAKAEADKIIAAFKARV